MNTGTKVGENKRNLGTMRETKYSVYFCFVVLKGLNTLDGFDETIEKKRRGCWKNFLLKHKSQNRRSGTYVKIIPNRRSEYERVLTTEIPVAFEKNTP